MKRLILFAFPLFMLACRPWRHDAGPQITEDRNPGTFYDLSVYGSADVHFSSDTSYIIRVSAPENWMSGIYTTVNNGRLKIEQDSHTDWFWGKVNIYISHTVYDEIYLSGSGDVDGSSAMQFSSFSHYGSGDVALTVNSNTVDLINQGSGDIYFNGAVPQLSIQLKGSGDLNFKDLNTVKSTITSTGSGDIRISVSDTLTVSITGSGDVYYWGTPSVLQSNITGSGQLIHMN